MLDYNMTEIFDALEEISLMDDESFEKLKTEFENNGLTLKRHKNSDSEYADILIEQK